jgi:hypothetical protein
VEGYAGSGHLTDLHDARAVRACRSCPVRAYSKASIGDARARPLHLQGIQGGAGMKGPWKTLSHSRLFACRTALFLRYDA